MTTEAAWEPVFCKALGAQAAGDIHGQLGSTSPTACHSSHELRRLRCCPAQEARAAQAEAEARAAEAAKLGAARRLKEAEARAESLEGLAGELRTELERQVGPACCPGGVAGCPVRGLQGCLQRCGSRALRRGPPECDGDVWMGGGACVLGASRAWPQRPSMPHPAVSAAQRTPGSGHLARGRPPRSCLHAGSEPR